MIDEGRDPLQVMRRTGHSNIKTTYNLFGHLFPDREEIKRRGCTGATPAQRKSATASKKRLSEKSDLESALAGGLACDRLVDSADREPGLTRETFGGPRWI
jgi:hypothetical protein